MLDGPKALVLYSGGMDSFVTACRLIESGHEVTLISFNNGALAAEENLLHGVTRLKNRYGSHVEYAGVYCHSAIIRQLEDDWAYMPQKLLGETYPSLINAQMTCLHCQTGMWIAAIAYAKAKNIRIIAAGNKSADPFCTGLKAWTDAMSAMAKKHGIAIRFPLWETPEWGNDPDYGRMREMENHGFMPAVLEPKCLLGRPVEPMNGTQADCMMLWFDDRLKMPADKLIDKMTGIFEHIRLSEKSLEPIHYPTPEKSPGAY